MGIGGDKVQKVSTVERGERDRMRKGNIQKVKERKSESESESTKIETELKRDKE